MTQYGNPIEDFCFRFTAFLFIMIGIILTTVDVMLLMRLKQFYLSFYEKEKMRIIIANALMVGFVCSRVAMNNIMQSQDYINDINESYRNDSWFFAIHQAIVLCLGFYGPNFAIIYSFLFAFAQKKSRI